MPKPDDPVGPCRILSLAEIGRQDPLGDSPGREPALDIQLPICRKIHSQRRINPLANTDRTIGLCWAIVHTVLRQTTGGREPDRPSLTSSPSGQTADYRSVRSAAPAGSTEH